MARKKNVKRRSNPPRGGKPDDYIKKMLPRGKASGKEPRVARKDIPRPAAEPARNQEQQFGRKKKFIYYTKEGVVRKGKMNKPYKFYGFIKKTTDKKYVENAYNRRLGRVGQNKAQSVLSLLKNNNRNIVMTR